jgi:hypothetical protein
MVLIGCCKINTKKKLPSLGFHHLVASKKNLVSKWDKISKCNITRIYDLLIEEKCVCLYSNCHSLIHSKSFINNLNDIIDPRSQSLIQSIMTDYNRIENNIKNYSFENILWEVSKK